MNTVEQDKMLAFVKAYWLAQPPPVRAFQDMPNTLPDGMLSPERGALAQELTRQGFDVDLPIMVWDWNPYYVMEVRQNEGVINPLYLSGHVIKVSIDLADFPPYEKPAPPPLADSRFVGRYTGFLNWYFSTTAGNTVANGASVVQDGDTFVKEITFTVTGPAHKFLKQ